MEVKVFSDSLQNLVDRLWSDRFVMVAAVIGCAAEHIIAQRHVRSILQIEGDSLDHGVINGDVTIALTLTGVAGLSLEHGEAVLEHQVLIDEVREAKLTQVADSQSKVNAYDEEHIIAEPSRRD